MVLRSLLRKHREKRKRTYKDQVKDPAGLTSFASGLALSTSGLASFASGLASFAGGLALSARTLST